MLDKRRPGRPQLPAVAIDGPGPGAYSVGEAQAAPEPTQERPQVPNVGLPELVIVLVIALVVFGPKRLPEMGQKLGHALREFRSATSEIRSQIGADEIADSVKDIKSTFSLTADGPRPATETVAEAPVAAASVAAAAAVSAGGPAQDVAAVTDAETGAAAIDTPVVEAPPGGPASDALPAGAPLADQVTGDGGSGAVTGAVTGTDEGGVEAFGSLKRRSTSSPVRTSGD